MVMTYNIGGTADTTEGHLATLLNVVIVKHLFNLYRKEAVRRGCAVDRYPEEEFREIVDKVGP